MFVNRNVFHFERNFTTTIKILKKNQYLKKCNLFNVKVNCVRVFLMTDLSKTTTSIWYIHMFLIKKLTTNLDYYRN